MEYKKTVWLETTLFFFILSVLVLHTGKTLFWFYLVMSLLTMVTLCRAWRSKTFFYSKIHLLLWTGILLLALNGLFSVYPVVSKVMSWKLSLFFWACMLLFGRCDLTWSRLFLCVTTVTLIVAVWAIAQYVTSGFSRTHGPQIDFNAFAAILYCGSLVCLAQYSSIPGHRYIWYFTSQFLILFAMMTTFSRGGITAWVISLIILWAIHLRLRFSVKPVVNYVLTGFSAWCVVKVLPWLLGLEGISRHFNDIGTLGARLPQWVSALQLFFETPWTGKGFGTFKALYPATRTEWSSAGNFVHNDYLQFAMEGGILFLALFIICLFFHVYLLAKLLLKSNKTFGNTAALRYELGALLTVNLMLFAHATINFIFYIGYLNFLSGLVFSRILTLALRLELIRPFKRICLSVISRLFVMVLLLVLWIKLSLTLVPHIYFFERKEAGKLVINQKTLSLLLDVDPTNVAGSEILIRATLDSLSRLPATKRQAAFDRAWSQARMMVERTSVEPRFYYWLGLLSEKAKALNLYNSDSPELPLYYYHRAIELHPGYFPSHIAIALSIEKNRTPEEALAYLVPVFDRWYKMVPVAETSHLLDIMARLANKVGDQERFSALLKVKANLHDWKKHVKWLFPRHEG